MPKFRVRLLAADGATVLEWKGFAADGYEAERLAEEAHPGAVAKSGTDLPDDVELG